MDDIVLTGNDHYVIHILKSFLGKEFEIKDLGHLRYFFGIEIAHSKKVIFLSSMF